MSGPFHVDHKSHRAADSKDKPHNSQTQTRSSMGQHLHRAGSHSGTRRPMLRVKLPPHDAQLLEHPGGEASMRARGIWGMLTQPLNLNPEPGENLGGGSMRIGLTDKPSGGSAVIGRDGRQASVEVELQMVRSPNSNRFTSFWEVNPKP